MNWRALIGLLLLLGLYPQTFINSKPLLQAQTTATPVQTNDPQQLFAQVMHLAEYGDRVEAGKQLDKACFQWIKSGESESAARARLRIGDLYRNDKRFKESLTQYSQARLIPDLSPSVQALIYDAVGQLYAELYQSDLAAHNYWMALGLLQKQKDYALEAQLQLHLAFLSDQDGDLLKAMDFAQRAVAANTKLNDQKALASSLDFLARMELKKGLAEKGRRDLERALTLYEHDNNLVAQANTLCRLSGINLSEQNVALAKEQATLGLSIAQDLFKKASPGAQKNRAFTNRGLCNLALGRVQRSSQQLKEARTSYNLAMGATNVALLSVYGSTERSAVAYAEESMAPYRELVGLAVDMRDNAEAYANVQRSRTRALSGLIRARRAKGSSATSGTDEKLRALSTSITAIRSKLLSPNLNTTQRTQLEQELSETEYLLSEKLFEDELTSPWLRMAYSEPAFVDDLQSRVLRDDETVLEFFLGEDRSFVWLISREQFTMEILPGRQAIEEKVRPYLNDLALVPNNLYLQSRIAKLKKAGDELFEFLLGKVAKQIRPNSKLIVIPDGLLNRLSYDSLVHDDRYLIEDHQINYVPSANFIELLRQPSTNQTAVDKVDLLAFGAPVFSQRSTDPLRTTTVETTSRASYWDTSKLADLPRTRDEVETIANLLPKGQSRVYLGKESTEKAFKQERLNRFKWIHLATHSLIDDLDPTRSAIVLSLDKNNEEDGFLRANEIANLNLEADIVILSACDTGGGKVFAGEGVVGLSRSFFIAGTRSVVASQWKVSDISTSQLMKDFYQRLVAGTNKSASLREAKLRMLRNGTATRHPYYWAPFVIIGAP